MTTTMASNPDPTALTGAKSPPSQNTNGRRRKWYTLLAISAVILSIAVLALPTMLGSRWIYDPLLKRLAREQFSLDIESVKLRWFSPLEFRGISIGQATDGETTNKTAPLVSIRAITSNRGLLSYLIHGRNLGRIEITDPKLDIELLENGSNLERLIKSIGGHPSKEILPTNPAPDTQPKSRSNSQPKLDLDLAIRGLSVQVEPKEGGTALVVVPKMDADISYRALEQDAQLIIHPMQVLKEAALTPELVRLGVGLAIPLLAKSAWFDGRISLTTKEIWVPLTSPVDSKGEATLTLHQVRSGPSEPLIVGALDALANLRGKEASHELVFVDGSQVFIQVADQRVFHSGLEAGLPRLDARLQVATQGYVGLVDRSLELSVEIPIPIEQLARREQVQQLGVPRVKLPVGGTLDDPEIKWNVMRGESALLLSAIAGKLQSDAPITSTIVEAIGDVTDGKADQAIATAVDFVKALRQRRAQEKASRTEDILPPGTDEPKDSEPRRPFRDALRKVLKGE
jgi:hypothetical protein